MKIRNIDSFEILDSRGTPTVMTSIELRTELLNLGTYLLELPQDQEKQLKKEMVEAALKARE